MKFKHIGLVLGGLLISLASYGQNYRITGQLYAHSEFQITDILKLSQFDNSFGTARSAALGGAMTSLGADLSSMSINPAGLGMYRGNDISVSPSLTISGTKSYDHYQGTDLNRGSNSRTNFGFNNFSAAFNLYQGSGALTSFTLGFGYNRVADLNNKSSVSRPGSSVTIGDVFLRQLDGISLSSVEGGYRHFDTFDWGAVLSYYSFFLDPVDPDNMRGTEYDIYTVSPDAFITNHTSTVTRGSIGEYNISGGFNHMNKFYWGFSIGFQDIYYKQNVYYTEEFTENYNTAGTPARGMSYNQYQKFSGFGVNFKFGAIYRPIDALRIGVAVHSPTFQDFRMHYRADMSMHFPNGTDFADTPKYDYDYKSLTPTRLMGGLSYIFGDKGLITADYERTWYNGLRYRNDDSAKDMYDTQFKHLFKASNTFRGGIEYKPQDNLALRAGYTFSSSLFDSEYFDTRTEMLNAPAMYKKMSVSTGVGYRFPSGAYLDLTYAYMHNNYSTYDLFYYEDNAGDEIWSGDIKSKQNKHNMILTYGFRF